MHHTSCLSAKTGLYWNGKPPTNAGGICVSWRGFYFDTTMPAGFQVPSPAGSTEGGVSLGQ